MQDFDEGLKKELDRHTSGRVGIPPAAARVGRKSGGGRKDGCSGKYRVVRLMMRDIKLILCIMIALMGFAIICGLMNAHHNSTKLDIIIDIITPPKTDLQKVIEALPEGEWEIVDNHGEIVD
jgi:hypothetical protein